MTYRIARDGQLFGPYTQAEVEHYLAIGRIVPTDLAQPDGAPEWLPIAELFPASAAGVPMYPGGLTALYEDPPDFPWWAVLILSVVTLGAFSAVWNIVESAWLYRVNRNSRALWFYAVLGLFFLLKLPDAWHSLGYNVFNGPHYDAHFGFLFTVTDWALAIAARFVFRSELHRHFNVDEPLGLRLNGLLTFFFGGLYFQYHFNRINELKRALHVSVKARADARG